ncbi:MAG: hypothetical protein WCJ56_02110 [bacterium]
MSRFLTPQPNLEHIKHEAKELRKALQGRQPEVIPVMRHIHRFSQASDAEIFAADVALTECQFALALDYGFSGWQELRRTILQLGVGPDYQASAADDAVMLPDTPAGIRNPSRYASAFAMAFNYIGVPTDYETVCGDSGAAFIFQADSLHTPFDTNVRQLDMGWWPLDEWGFFLRLGFISEVNGVPLHIVPSVHAEYKADPARHYHDHHEAEILDSIDAGRPAIGAVGNDINLIVGYDDGNPPLHGQLSCVDEVKVQRIGRYPYDVVILGDPGPRMDRLEADVQALNFAIALGRDEVELAHLPGKSSGAKSWLLWEQQLADDELCGPHYFSANVVGHLRINRSNAATYLRTMSTRHTPAVAAHLLHAAGLYDELEALMRTADVSKEAFATLEGRTPLITLLHTCSALDAQATTALAEAVAAM